MNAPVSYIVGRKRLVALELGRRKARQTKADALTWSLFERMSSGLWMPRGRAHDEPSAIAFVLYGPHDLFERAAAPARGHARECRVDGCGRDAAAGSHGFCELHLGRVAGAWLQLWERATSQKDLEALWSKLADELAFREGGVS